MNGDPGVGDEDIRLGIRLKRLEIRPFGEVGLQREIDLLPYRAVRSEAQAAEVGPVEQRRAPEALLDVGRHAIPPAIPIEAAADVEFERLVAGLAHEAFVEVEP